MRIPVATNGLGGFWYRVLRGVLRRVLRLTSGTEEQTEQRNYPGYFHCHSP